MALRFRRVLTTLHRALSAPPTTPSLGRALSTLRSPNPLGRSPLRFFSEGRQFKLPKDPKPSPEEMVGTYERICAQDLNLRMKDRAHVISGGMVTQNLGPRQTLAKRFDFQSRCFSTSSSPPPPDLPFSTTPPSGETDLDAQRISRPMDFVRKILRQDESWFAGYGTDQRSNEQNADFVHINIKRNNTFVTITDSKGNKKFGASMGCVDELKGGQKMTRYVTEATAEHAGRAARGLGLNSVVVRVKGFTYFRKKKQAIMSFKEGYGDRNTIVSIEDTTRRPHNGCRLPKKRRI